MKLGYALAALACVIGTFDGGSSAAASSSPDPIDEHAGRTIRLFATVVQEENIDLGAQGATPGDLYAFSESLAYREGAKPIGMNGGNCVDVRIDDNARTITVHCTITADLGDGQIAMQGLMTIKFGDPTGTFTAAVTGGSGAYINASGQTTVQKLDARRSHVTIRLAR